MAIDNSSSSPRRGYLYVTWIAAGPTDLFDTSKVMFSCSSNCGQSWSTPSTLDSEYDLPPAGATSATAAPNDTTIVAPGVQTIPNHYLQFAMPAVAPNGDVYVVWADCWDMGQGNMPLPDSSKFKIVKSANGGTSFSASSQVRFTFKKLLSSGLYHIRIANIPSMAVEPLTSDVLIVFKDQVNANDTSARIKITKSTNGGLDWDSPRIIGDDIGTGGLHWEYFPSISVDGTGRIAVSYLHSADSSRYLDTYLIQSLNQGTSFTPPVKITCERSKTWPTQNPYDYQGIASSAGADFLVWTDVRTDGPYAANIYYARIAALGVQATSGWNMLSVPDSVASFAKTTVWAGANSAASTTLGGSYVLKDTLTLGVAYWIKFPADEVIDYVGAPVTVKTIALSEGWNMIGSLSTPINTRTITFSPSGILDSWYFKYAGSTYITDTIIRPGTGYWVKVTGAGTLTMDASSTANTPQKTSSASPPDPPSPPPAPVLASPTNGVTEQPTGISLSWNSSSGATRYHIQVSAYSDMDPLTTNDATMTGTNRFDTLAYNQWYWWRISAINDAGEGAWSAQWSFKTINPSCEPNCPPDPCENSIVYGGGDDPQPDQIDPCDYTRTLNRNHSGEANRATPKHYALEQNMPNPFNPTTSIRYALPKDGLVQLRVFNMLGQEVKSLVDEFQTSGYKSIEFDGSNLSTGLYFYRMQAGRFVDIKKMMLVK